MKQLAGFPLEICTKKTYDIMGKEMQFSSRIKSLEEEARWRTASPALLRVQGNLAALWELCWKGDRARGNF